MGSPELVAMMLADARLPTGGHTQSGGLEPAVRAGLGADGNKLAEVEQYARDRLRTVTRVEAGTAVVARHLTRSNWPLQPDRPATPAGGIEGLEAPETACAGGIKGPEAPEAACPDGIEGPEAPEAACAGKIEGLEALDAAWAARVPSQVLRSVARRQGRAYLRLAARVWPRVSDYLPADREVPRPIVVGVVAAVNELSAVQTARLIAYDDAQTVVAASLKLLPVDPADAACWLAALHPDIEDLVVDVAGLTRATDLPAYGAPLIDVYAQNHSIERMRLFHA